MNGAGERNLLILIIVGIAAGLLLVFLLVRALRGGYETVDPIAQFELPPPDVQVEGESPRARPSVALHSIEDQQTPTPTFTPKPTLSDEEQLAEITANWVYRGFAGLGEQKTGRFTRYVPEGRETVQFFIRQGDALQGVTVDKLDVLAAVASLGEATVMLPLVPETPPECQPDGKSIHSFQRGSRCGADCRIGKTTVSAFSKWENDIHPDRARLCPRPKPPTEEENKAAMNRYMATYAPLMKQQSAQRTPVPGEGDAATASGSHR